MRHLTYLYNLLVLGKEKALVGFVVVAVLGGLAHLGITGDMTVRDALTLLVTAVLTWISVYMKRNN